MTYRFHSEASAELASAAEYYRKVRPSLGLEFALEVQSAIVRILDFPEAWSPFSLNTRRCLVDRFPYGVIYRMDSGEVHIIAVAHLSRAPHYWQSRL